MKMDSFQLDTLAFFIVEEMRKKSFRFFNTLQVAEMMNLKVQEVNRKFAKGELKGVKKGKYWYITEKDLFESIFGDEKELDKERPLTGTIK